MDEENKNTVAGAENTENGAAQTAESQSAKTYTQEEVDNIVKARLGRERNRVEKLYPDYEGLKQVYSTLKEIGVAKSDDVKEAANDIRRFYAKGDSDTAGEPSEKEPIKQGGSLPADQRLDLVEYSASKKADKLSDEELEDEVQSLKEKGKSRTDEDDIRFMVYTKKLSDINAKKGSQRQLDEFKARFPKVNLTELQNDGDFKEFARISRVPLADTYAAYQKFKGVEPAKKADLGSVSTQGNTTEKDLLTPEQLQRLTPDEVAKNRELVRKSIIANIKKNIKNKDV